jgi:hypothetical protein
LPYNPGLGHPFLWCYKLNPLAGFPGLLGVVKGRVADALNQACSDSSDSQFERWVRQEPEPAHP